MANKQIKSKECVSSRGQAVNDVYDLAQQDVQRIESHFLDTACGDGDFLAEVLRRKLAVVVQRYGNSPMDYERYAVMALSSLYGVDILPDNATECRHRLAMLWVDTYADTLYSKPDSQCCKTVTYLMKTNILCGDALTMTKADGSPLVFAEWSLITGSLVKRRDISLHAFPKGKQAQMDMVGWDYDTDLDAFTPVPLRKYPLISPQDYHNLFDLQPII